MPERINVYLPDDLHRAIGLYRERINVSRICQDALAREVSRLANLERADAPLPQLGEDERAAIAARLRGEKVHRQSYWYSLGYRTAFAWARERADPEALEALASGGAMQAQPIPGWIEGMQVAPRRQAVAARTWGDLHRQAVEVADRRGRAPGLDLGAFNRGVRDGSKAVWDAVCDDVLGQDGGEAGFADRAAVLAPPPEGDGGAEGSAAGDAARQAPGGPEM